MTEIFNISAHTKYPNTKETDKLDKVMHIVNFTLKDEKNYSMEVMANCPLDAMNIVKAIMTLKNLEEKSKNGRWNND
jgi:hypothetical protein